MKACDFGTPIHPSILSVIVSCDLFFCVGFNLTWLAGSMVVCLMCLFHIFIYLIFHITLKAALQCHEHAHRTRQRNTKFNNRYKYNKKKREAFHQTSGSLPHQTDPGPVCGGGWRGEGEGEGGGERSGEEADE